MATGALVSGARFIRAPQLVMLMILTCKIGPIKTLLDALSAELDPQLARRLLLRGRLLWRLSGERAAVALFWCADGLLEDQLTDPHTRIEHHGVWPEIEDFQLDLSLEPRVDRRSSYMNTNAETCQAALALDSRSQPR